MTEFFCNFAVCKKAKDIFKTRMINKTPLYLLLAMAVTLMSLPALVSCNHNDDDDDSVYSYSTSEQTTLVTSLPSRLMLMFWLAWIRCISLWITIKV